MPLEAQEQLRDALFQMSEDRAILLFKFITQFPDSEIGIAKLHDC
jgi:hypothetical protein